MNSNTITNQRLLSSDNPVDVCVVCNWFYPIFSGAGERFRRYAPGLRERGIHLQVFTIKYPGLSPFEVVDGIPVQRVSVDKSSRYCDFILLSKLIRWLLWSKRRPDVLQFLNPSYWNSPFVWMLRKLGIPCIFVFTLMGGNDSSWIKKRLRKVYRRWLFKSFDYVVTSTEVMAQELRTNGVPMAHIETIPNGVDLIRFRPAESQNERWELRELLGIQPDSQVVVFVGGILPRKGVDILVTSWYEVARRYHKAKLILVGPFHKDQLKHQSFYNKIDRLVAESPAPEQIIFTGTVHNVEVFLRAADVFVLPSVREGMTNAVPEAMATGLPCILTPFLGLSAELGQAGREYYLASRDPESISTAILELLGDAEKRRVIGEQARRWVEQHLSVESSLDKFTELYRKLSARYR